VRSAEIAGPDHGPAALVGGHRQALPLTHGLALFRCGLTPVAGAKALHNIWGLSNVREMAALSLLVVAAYAFVLFGVGLRLFTRNGTS